MLVKFLKDKSFSPSGCDVDSVKAGEERRNVPKNLIEGYKKLGIIKILKEPEPVKDETPPDLADVTAEEIVEGMKLLEEGNKALLEGQTELGEDIKDLEEDNAALLEGQTKLDEGLKGLTDGQEVLKREQDEFTKARSTFDEEYAAFVKDKKAFEKASKKK